MTWWARLVRLLGWLPHRHEPAWILRWDDGPARGLGQRNPGGSWSYPAGAGLTQRDYTVGCVLCRRQLHAGEYDRASLGTLPYRADIRERL